MAATQPLEYTYLIVERVPNVNAPVNHYSTLNHYQAIIAVKNLAKQKLIEHGGEAEEELKIYPLGQQPEDKDRKGYVIYVQEAAGKHIYNVKKFRAGWVYNSDDILTTVNIERVPRYNREKHQKDLISLAAAPARIVMTDNMEPTMKKEAENREQLHDQLSESLKKRQAQNVNDEMTSSVFGEFKKKNVIDPVMDKINNEMIDIVIAMEKRKGRM